MNDVRQNLLVFGQTVSSTFIRIMKSPETLSFVAAMVFFYLISNISENRGLTQGPKVPDKIFSPSSPVADFNMGDLGAALDFISDEGTEYWFVMYYAHWDAASLEVVTEFDNVAREFLGKVTFVAVNCWWPFGTCKSRVNPFMYPAFVGHVVDCQGIQYTGIKKAKDFKHFVEKLMSPFSYIQDKEDILTLRAQDDTIAVAYFDFANTLTPRGWLSFHQASLSSLEKDIIEPVPFAVVTNKQLAANIGLRETKSLVLLRNFNYSVIFPAEKRFKASEIVSWVYGELREQMVQWISPAGVKSLIMSSQLLQGPALLFFTTHNHDRGFDNDFYLLRELALQYYNCNGTSKLLTKLVSILQEKRHSSRCVNKSTSQTANSKSSDSSQCCQTIANLKYTRHFIPTGNVCQICEQNLYQPHQLSYVPCNFVPQNGCRTLWSQLGESIFAIPDSCKYVSNFYNPFSHCELCCTKNHHYQAKHMLPQTNLHRTHDYSYREQCTDSNCKTNLFSSSKYSEDYNIESCDIGADDLNLVLPEFLGLGCKANKTINFFGVRSEYFSHLAKRLGVKHLSVSKGRSRAAIIVDMKEEEHAILNLSSSAVSKSLQRAILNFSQRSLRRHVVSANKPAYGVQKYNLCTDVTQPGCIVEVTTDTFQEVVLDSKKDVLLFYYASWCGACKRLYHTYLAVAQTFWSTEGITIARINGAENDLPWEYTPISYPSFIFFPLGHKEDSTTFPNNLPITFFNIVQFIIQQSSDRH